MNQYIIIHKKSERKIILSYDNTFSILRAVELSNARWSEEEITIVLRHANKLRTEVSFIKKMEEKDPDFDYLEMPKDLRFEVFWNLYGYKKGKIATTQKAWNALTEADKIEVLLYIPKFKESKKIDKTAMPYPSTFLNQKYWLADKI
ncbi:hypothetical protein [Riemerella anatipestifer]|uniref:hypothetical protein n=1 Tax=Riemerella anatipestifer TaxID=34085 RepID=UPI0021F81F04|nr:hypothetical protein [Riemerella anatipestifer]MCW0518318.1 hypothetical protein [Riemerella anatipestifer]